MIDFWINEHVMHMQNVKYEMITYAHRTNTAAVFWMAHCCHNSINVIVRLGMPLFSRCRWCMLDWADGSRWGSIAVRLLPVTDDRWIAHIASVQLFCNQSKQENKNLNQFSSSSCFLNHHGQYVANVTLIYVLYIEPRVKNKPCTAVIIDLLPKAPERRPTVTASTPPSKSYSNVSRNLSEFDRRLSFQFQCQYFLPLLPNELRLRSCSWHIVSFAADALFSFARISYLYFSNLASISSSSSSTSSPPLFGLMQQQRGHNVWHSQQQMNHLHLRHPEASLCWGQHIPVYNANWLSLLDRRPPWAPLLEFLVILRRNFDRTMLLLVFVCDSVVGDDAGSCCDAFVPAIPFVTGCCFFFFGTNLKCRDSVRFSLLLQNMSLPNIL